ncbi:type VI secretion protein [Mesorhizobium sp. B2-3-14]|uniref:virB8 family protein n=1 Tax=unclassified Mesorhizobium TaxID=325217 RepID=UPI0011279E7B|nr:MULTISPECIES: type IV secretion system protein [unclassified Mesorhizobium]MBZ9931817.1 type VI secretion protein [Mesorhizobium sp. BR1-1-5]MBZ9905624.1 type VI secretion protein [Mesorhizobium sp. BR115XR7A]TPJ13750.1 type VI secretion protein [Mesorhizobium sp. B2-7-3]TPK73873.1 type VI secretion protein [Mesorhizobium sp. B2-4-18]TPL74107.1 type VI secretion protein [Mesorhizobium sp. B2-3-15]
MAEPLDEKLRSYFQDGDVWEHEIFKRAMRSSRIAWFFTLLFASIAALALLALVLMVPLKSFEPYVVEVDRNTGYIEVKSGLTRTSDLTGQEAVTQANVVRYIRNREGYDPFAIDEYFGIAALLSTDEAARDLQMQFSAANAQNPAKIYGRLKRVLVDIKSVTFPNASTAIVRFSTTEKSETEAIHRHWISVVRFRYTESPLKNEWRFENPLGFQVYSYRRDQETVTPGGSE